jgi:hypothetical protein
MSISVNPPPQVKIPDKFFNDPELRAFFEQQRTILFQLWNRTGGPTDLISQIITIGGQINVINVENVDLLMSSEQFGSLVVVDASTAEVNITLPSVSNDDIGKSVMVVIIDATFDCYIKGNGDSVLGEASVLMNDQYMSIHFTSISNTDWIAQ